MSIIARGAGDRAWKRVEPHLSNYMGKVFEEICKQYLWHLLLEDKSPVQFSVLGRWWGNDAKLKKQAEIDIVGIQDKDTALFGECKWTNEPVDVDAAETLVHRAGLFQYTSQHLFIFAKHGFSEQCKAFAARRTDLTLVTFADIMKVLDPITKG